MTRTLNMRSVIRWLQNLDWLAMFSPVYVFVLILKLSHYSGSFDLVAVADPGFRGVRHRSSYLFSLLHWLLLVPLLFKESHFLDEFERADVLEKVMHFPVVRLFEFCILFIASVKFFLMFFIQLHGIILVLLISLLEILFESLLSLTHLLFVIAHRFLELLLPFLVVSFHDGLHALSSFCQTLIRKCAFLCFLFTILFFSFTWFLRLFGFGFFVFLLMMLLWFFLRLFFRFFIIILIILILFLFFFRLTQLLCFLFSFGFLFLLFLLLLKLFLFNLFLFFLLNFGLFKFFCFL